MRELTFASVAALVVAGVGIGLKQLLQIPMSWQLIVIGIVSVLLVLLLWYSWPLACARQMGLYRFLTRTDLQGRDHLKRMISRVKDDDELLLLGRTLLGVVESKSDELKRAPERGQSIKVMVLNPAHLRAEAASQQIDLSPLGLGADASSRLEADTRGTLERPDEIATKARNEGDKGRLEVRVTNILLLNSVVARSRNLPKDQENIEVSVDFSFGYNDADKFSEIFRSNRKETFTWRLYWFYRRMFKTGGVRWMYYKGKGRDIEYEDDYLRYLERPAITSVIERSSDQENIRNNPVSNLASWTPNLFAAIHARRAPVAPRSVQVEITNQ